jgi:hypothetical protein
VSEAVAHVLPAAQQVRKELDYWRSLPQDRDLEPLYFWRQHASRMPHLSQLARLLLGMPGSSAGLERAFSHAGRAGIGPRRPRLKPETACDVLFAHENFIRDVF